MQLNQNLYTLFYQTVDFLGLLFDAALIVYLGNLFFLPRPRMSTRLRILGGFPLVSALLYFLGYGRAFSWFVLSIFLVAFLYCLVFFRDVLTMELTVCCMFCSLYFIMDIIYQSAYAPVAAMFRTSLFPTTEFVMLLFRRVICKLFMYLLLRFLHRSFVRPHKGLPSAYQTCLLVFCGFDATLMLFNIYYLNTNRQSDGSSVFVTVFMIGCFCILLSFFYLFMAMLRQYEANLESRLQVTETELHRQYLEQAKDMLISARQFRHDVKSHLFCMEGLLEQKNYTELGYYMKELGEADFLHLPVYSWCQYDRLNTILTQKAKTAEQNQIPFSIRIQLSDQLCVRQLDLCTLLSNVCDNALEASLQTAAPDISFELREVKGYLSLKATNRVARNVLSENPLLTTTKSDSQNHGMGTSIIRSIARRYNGSADFSCTDDTFTCYVLLENVAPAAGI